ncbi:ligand-binding sensor domain-containing protein [Foetidibacter luteolus]|uniref:ligand-binding sensor domain-containing protein n=1 Tax=Foetidibacter luteolus TaxID=2608880 RepID=UPI00129A785B|nr:sensor histidine kinase [Foetidibacter luteolus]
MGKRTAHVLLFIGIAYCCQGQLDQHIAFTKYTQKDGLSSFNIKKIHQDKFGFLWIATQDGLSCFDGKNFTSFNMATPGLQLIGPDIRDFLEDSAKNEIWVLAATGGISVFNTATRKLQRNIPVPVTGNNQWNSGFLKCGGHIWVSGSTGLNIYDIKTGAWLGDPGNQSAPVSNGQRFISRMITDPYGNVWCFADNNGIEIYKPLPAVKLRDIHFNERIAFYDAAFISSTALLIGSDKGLRLLNVSPGYTTIKFAASKGAMASLANRQVFAIAPHGQDILIASGDGLCRLNKDLVIVKKYTEPVPANEEAWIKSIRYIYTQNRHCLWLACRNGVAKAYLMEPAFTAFFDDKNHQQRLDNVFAIEPVNGSTVFAGLEHGLKKVDYASKDIINIDGQNSYYGIVKGPNNAVLASNQSGTFLLKNDSEIKLSTAYPEFAGLDFVQYNSVASYGDTLFVLGSESMDGVVAWNSKAHTVEVINTTSKTHKLASDIVNRVYKDKTGRLWVLSDQIISLLNSDFSVQRELSYHRSASDSVLYYFDICETKSGFWIAAYGTGLLQLDDKFNLVKVYSKANGLCDNGVYKLFNYNDSLLVVTTNNGLSTFDLVHEKFKNYYSKDGLHNDAFEENVGRFYNGLIYAGGLKGFTVIDPSKFTTNPLPPRVYFTSVTIQYKNAVSDTTDVEIGRLVIPAEWLQASIKFSAINFSAPEHVMYQYRIANQDSSWVNLGHQDFISFIGLSPGDYNLQVRAMNEDGYWSEPRQLVLTFLPKWYQAWWFKALLAIAAAGILYAVYSYRIRQVKKQQQIRKNIASDLHDDIGNTLNSVRMFTHLAETSEDKEPYFTLIKDSLKQASVGLRDMIWVLDDKRDSVDELMGRLKMFAAPLANAGGVNLFFDVPDTASRLLLGKTEKRNLLLIAKEAISNSIKYSECNTIAITFYKTDGKKTFTLSDDGKGFKTEDVASGNGLGNMRDRALQIKYTFSLQSAPGQGTKITITSKR